MGTQTEDFFENLPPSREMEKRAMLSCPHEIIPCGASLASSAGLRSANLTAGIASVAPRVLRKRIRRSALDILEELPVDANRELRVREISVPGEIATSESLEMPLQIGRSRIEAHIRG